MGGHREGEKIIETCGEEVIENFSFRLRGSIGMILICESRDT